MTEEVKIEHHWHDPTQGQVVKAMYQYLSDKGVSEQAITEICMKKIGEVIQKKINDVIGSGKFDDLLVCAIASFVRNEKELFDRKDGYTMRAKMRDLIQKELQEMLVKDYSISVTPRK